VSDTVLRTNSASEDYRANERAVLAALKNSPIPDKEVLENVYLYLTPQHMRRLLFLYELYQKILTVPGVILQMGVRWGRDLAAFEALRTTFEPFNHSRRLLGFDTFEGFVGTDSKDGDRAMIREGNFAVAGGYEATLEQYLRAREALSPLPHVRKFELIKGDASETVPAYLNEHPETIIALAYFDMDIYKPTVRCLEKVREHLTKGSVVVLDEVNCPEFPGETVALREVFGLRNIRLERHPHVNPTWPAYFVVE